MDPLGSPRLAWMLNQGATISLSHCPACAMVAVYMGEVPPVVCSGCAGFRGSTVPLFRVYYPVVSFQGGDAAALEASQNQRQVHRLEVDPYPGHVILRHQVMGFNTDSGLVEE